VGGWLTELFGIRDPWVLDRAFALGQAMQLTNILRDVGEDLRMGRLYLPEDLMAHYGIDRDLLEAKARNGSPAFPGYQRLVEALIAEAESDYELAFEAIPALPSFFQGPVAVAASVYRGIHEEIRRNGYDNLSRRARTSFPRKMVLGAQGLWALKRASTRQNQNKRERVIPLPPFGQDKERQAAS
jgi:phytoene synthase